MTTPKIYKLEESTNTNMLPGNLKGLPDELINTLSPGYDSLRNAGFPIPTLVNRGVL